MKMGPVFAPMAGDENLAALFSKHPLRHAAHEFSCANYALNFMCKYPMGDFRQYEIAWREFLHRLDRVWPKTEASVRHMTGWAAVKSDVGHARNSDPLLVYLRQARNSDEHSIEDVAKEWDGALEATHVGDTVHLSWQQWDRPLLPVSNRGVTYQPPRLHLHADITPLLGKGKAEPRVMAELAMKFYVDFLNRVSSEVVGTQRDP